MRSISFPLACLVLAPLGPVSVTAQEPEATDQLTGCHDISVGEWYVAYDPGPPRPNEETSWVGYLLPDRIEFAAEDGDRKSPYTRITVVRSIELWYPPEEYDQFSSRFRDVFGSPDEDTTPRPSLALHWKKRIIDLRLMIAHRPVVGTRTVVTLYDQRW